MEIENMSIKAIENFLEKKISETEFIGAYYNFNVNRMGIQLIDRTSKIQIGKRLLASIPALKQAIEYFDKIKK